MGLRHRSVRSHRLSPKPLRLTSFYLSLMYTPAQRLNAYILIGFAQRLPPGPAPSSSGAHALPSPLYNSQMIVSPSGNLVSVYAKHFLYTTDEAWATPGPSFTTVSLPFPCSNPAASGDDNDGPPSFTIAPGICMDLNPEGFIAPFEAFEFATFVREAKPRVDVVVCSMAWLASEKEEEGDEEADGEEEDQAEDSEWHKVSGTIDYWATRLSPLVGTPTAFLASNRVGSEGGESGPLFRVILLTSSLIFAEVTFTGSSCVLELQGLTVVAHAKQSGEEVVCAVVRIE